MKKLLIGLLALSSISSFAGTEFCENEKAKLMESREQIYIVDATFEQKQAMLNINNSALKILGLTCGTVVPAPADRCQQDLEQINNEKTKVQSFDISVERKELMLGIVSSAEKIVKASCN